MKLISWNVNGLRACITKGFFDFLNEQQPDIIGLQETKMQPEQFDGTVGGIQTRRLLCLLEQRRKKRLLRHSSVCEAGAAQRHLRH